MKNLPQLQQANQNPLAELKDIHLPDPISWWPIAPGWWILLILVLGLMTWAVYSILIRHHATKYRREANTLLTSLKEAYDSDSDKEFNSVKQTYLKDIQSLLKRVALQSYPKDQIENLTGERWFNYLDSKCSNANFSQSFSHLALIHYQSTGEISQQDLKNFTLQSERWISAHKTNASGGKR